MSVSSPTRLRAERVEVRLSREKILAAAEAHYAVRDADPTMAELAKLAGVGNATLYRRYPTIDDVIRDLYAQEVRHFESVAQAVLAQRTGWDAIVALVMGIIDTLQAHPCIPRLNRKMVAQDDDHSFTARWDAQLDQIVLLAQSEGTLRPDVNSNDITFAAFRIGGYLNLPPNEQERIIGRQVGIILDGLRRDGQRSTLPGSPISPDDLHEIFRYEVSNPVESTGPRWVE